MTRVTSSVTHKKRVKKVLKAAKGYFGKRKNAYSIAKQSVMRANRYSFEHRRKKKGTFKRLWQVRINAALQGLGVKYSRLIHLLKKAEVRLNRKSLAFLAEKDATGFKALIERVTSKKQP